MRIPTDIPLSKYIRQLIREDKIVKFYLSDDWKELKEDVLEYFHYECQECLKKGTYTRADCVHHVNEVKKHPHLALSRHYTDSAGKRQYNLLPLCNECHNIVHERFGEYENKQGFTNTERW